MEEQLKKRRMGYIFILLGFGLLIISSGLALREYFFYRASIGEVSNVPSILGFMASELLVLIVKVAFLGVVIAASSILLRYGLEFLKESRK
ncbi:MAG TPA: hypothetical protein VKU94_05670 [Geobacterales bacterium]|nr:hypothetical protein [Geobacterales bacterium]